MSGQGKTPLGQNKISRRGFLKGTLGGLFFFLLPPFRGTSAAAPSVTNPLFWVKNIPNQPFLTGGNGNRHAGIECLIRVMGDQGLKFYRSPQESLLSGAAGLIAPDDVVLIKVNAQWKYRGSTNSDLIRGLIQRVLDHPDGFTGEVVIFENGQSQGSLNGDALGWGSYPDTSVHANANDETHSFNYLVNTVFHDPRVSSYLLDPIRSNFIGATDHASNGYRKLEDVSYPCFTSVGGHRVELLEGIWQGTGYGQNLKLINVPVLKIHGGSEITASLKHLYGVLSMADGATTNRHYSGLGSTCGKMVVSVRTPVLNIVDAIWVSYGSLSGYPANTTTRANQILASQDPVALDYCAAKYLLYPITKSSNHLPAYSGIDAWLTAARDMVNGRGGLYDPESGVEIGNVTKAESEMVIVPTGVSPRIIDFDGDGKTDVLWQHTSGSVAVWLMNGTAKSSVGVPGSAGTDWQIKGVGDFDGNGRSDLLWQHALGTVALWLMNGAAISSVGVSGTAGTDWQIEGVGDFDGDGKADILWQHGPTGTIAMWLMNGVSIGSVGAAGEVGSDWQIRGVGDFDGDGKADILWQHTSGTVAIWFMNGTSISSVGVPGAVSSDWQIKGVGDFDGDGKTDILWQHGPTGTVALWLMRGAAVSSVGIAGATGADWQIKGVGDFDGDGKADVLWQHTSGTVAIWLMNGAAISSVGVPGATDSSWQILNS
jgi:hypothetical protein